MIQDLDFNKKMDSKNQYNKILVLGIDGMDYTVSRALMAAGKLPTFLELSKKGSLLRLDTSNPAESPVAWVSISTGMNPGKHNIFDFIRRDPQTYIPELSLSKTKHGISGTNYETYVKGTPFWKITTDANIPTTVIRWPVTFPPEEVKGKMLAGLGVPDIKGFLSGYSYYSEERIEDSENIDKIIYIENNNGRINTYVKGPKKKTSDDIIDITSQMNIEIIDKSIKLVVDDVEHNLNEGDWSDWIRTSFKVGTFNKINGIFKANLISVNPFKMYVTTIQIDPENPVVDISYPKSYSKDLAGDIGLYYTLGMPEETDGYVDEKIDKTAFLKQTEDIEEQREKMFWKEFNNLNNKDKGLLAFVFDTSDRLQHVFWNQKVLDKEDDKLSLNKVVVDYYEKKDKFLQQVLEKMDDKTLLLIISDHGITSFERAFNMNNWLVQEGFMSLTKELNGGGDVPLFRNVDWDTSRAYSLGFSSLYINLRGREGQGVVNDKELVTKELIKKLEEVIDPKTGKTVINKVYKREDIYSGEFLNDAPDLIIGFNAGYRMSWQTAIGGFGKEILEDNQKKWNGDHLVDPKFVPGVLFSNAKIDGKFAHQMDIAPTILKVLGLGVSEQMDGKSLLES